MSALTYLNFSVLFLFGLFGPSVILDFSFPAKQFKSIERLIFSLTAFLLVGVIAQEIESLGVFSVFYLLCILLFLLMAIRRAVRCLRGDQPWWKKRDLTIPILFLLVAGYTSIAGLYGEVPADVYSHLGGIQEAGRLSESGLFSLSYPWYFLVGRVMSISGVHGSAALAALSVISPVVFLMLVKETAEGIFAPLPNGPRQASILVALSLVLTVLMFGTSIFSYVRYYILSPGYLMYPVFLYCASICVQLFSSPRKDEDVSCIIFLALGLCVTFNFHKQECLFVLLVVWTCWVVWTCHHAYEKVKRFKSSTKNRLVEIGWLQLLVSGLLTSAIPVVLYVMAPAPSADSILYNNTIGLGEKFGWREVWVIADPRGRVFETLGLWGSLVVFGYLFLVPNKDKNRLLTILVVLPPLLVFNPMFTSVFLGQTEPSVLWRLFYMTPIGIVGVYLGFFLIKGSSFQVVRYGLLSALIISLFPLPGLTDYQNLRYATLRKIQEDNSYHMWNDLIEFLEHYKGWKIVTDPVTGYVVSGLTGVQHWHSKFTPGPSYHTFNKEKYFADSFIDYGSSGWLFVVNLRDGRPSVTGTISGHWPGQIMRVSEHYSERFLEYLGIPNQKSEDHPLKVLRPLSKELPLIMEEIWQRENVWVFRPTRP
jgi:hypothetical protein